MKKKKYFQFNSNRYLKEVKKLYPYQNKKNCLEVYIERCKLISIDAQYENRKILELYTCLETQSQGQIITDSISDFADIEDFFPSPKAGDEMIVIFKKQEQKPNYQILGFTPEVKEQMIYDYCIKHGKNVSEAFLKNLPVSIDPLIFPISFTGKRIPLFKFAYENKIEWLLNYLLRQRKLYRNLIKYPNIDFDLASYLIEKDDRRLISHIIDNYNNARAYFSKSIDSLEGEIL